VLVFVTHVLTC